MFICTQYLHENLTMKQLLPLAFTAMLFFSACDNQQIADTDFQSTLFPVQFTIHMEKEVIPFPGTRSIPDYNLPEPESSTTPETSESTLSELCTQLEYLVYKEGETPVLVKHRKYAWDPKNPDLDFGIVYDSLPQGNYQICFLAHNSPQNAFAENQFNFERVSDSFYKQLSLPIDVAEVINQDVLLNRTVSRIEFMATDVIHSGLKQFEIHSTGQASQFNILTGKGVASTEKLVHTTTFTEDQLGLKDHIQSFYTFIDDAQPIIDVELLALDFADNLIRKRTINSIRPEINKIIRYKGRLYSRSESDDTFQLSIFNNGVWETTTEEELPEYDI